MAVEICPAETIPRISFSHDFCSSMQQYCPPFRSTSLPLNSSTEFEFDVRINNIYYYSSADKLFSNGKILPLQIKKQEEQPAPKKLQPQAGNARSNNHNQSFKSFWQFKRGSSLNFVSGYNKPRLCPSTLLSRGSSTGSAPKVKPGSRTGNHRQKNYQKEKSLPCPAVSINPILNVPLVDVYCLSSVFLTGKDRKK